jgi:hypothetical protein
VRYLAAGEKPRSATFTWRVCRVDRGAPTPRPEDDQSVGIDTLSSAVQDAKRFLFAGTPSAVVPALEDVESPPSSVFRSARVRDSNVGYVKIWRFDNADTISDEFRGIITREEYRGGLIIDVRGNSGGNPVVAERLLQLLTPRKITPEPFFLINTGATSRLAHGERVLRPWRDAIDRGIVAGSPFSVCLPIRAPREYNETGQRYYAPVVLLTDALTYSAAELFAAGFQDHQIGKVLGVHETTGGGGAETWSQESLRDVFDPPLKQLPASARLELAIRRSIRVGGNVPEDTGRQGKAPAGNGQPGNGQGDATPGGNQVGDSAGQPLEGLGVQSDSTHAMTRDDLLQGNSDLIKHAIEILNSSPRRGRSLSATAAIAADGLATISVQVRNIPRLDLYVDGRPVDSKDVASNSGITFDKRSTATAGKIEVRGYDGQELVAVWRGALSDLIENAAAAPKTAATPASDAVNGAPGVKPVAAPVVQPAVEPPGGAAPAGPGQVGSTPPPQPG